MKQITQQATQQEVTQTKRKHDSPGSANKQIRVRDNSPEYQNYSDENTSINSNSDETKMDENSL
jgi:hypothetical protein